MRLVPRKLLAIAAAHEIGDRLAAREAAECVRQRAALLDAVAHEVRRVVVGQRAHGRRQVLHREAVLVLAERLRAGREAREVEEQERPPVDARRAVVGARHRAMLEVPVRDVPAGVALDRHARVHAGHEVDPLLVGEEAARNVDHAVALELALPPRDEAARDVGLPERDEPQVVAAALQDRQFRRMPAVVEPAGQVRRQHDVGVVQAREHRSMEP